MGKCMHYKKIKLKINGSFTKRINILVYQEPKSHSNKKTNRVLSVLLTPALK